MERKTITMWNNWSVGFFIITCIATVGFALIHNHSAKNYASALTNYRKNAAIYAHEDAKEISHSLDYIYQGIRTISLLPSVKSIDRHGKHLDANAHASIVQIYNNMASNVAVSEIYIVPVDINPDAIDPMTGKKQEPILMFDGNVSSKTTGIGKNLVEDESQEYALLREQAAYFKEHFPNVSHIDHLRLPLLSSPELITCDNSEYATTRVDADRLGIVFSVPFYGTNGILKGTISAIIRSNIIRDMLPASNHSLINQNHKIHLAAKTPGQQTASNAWVTQGKADPNLIFSTTIPVTTADIQSNWALWVGLPDQQFLESPEVKAIHDAQYFGYLFVTLLTLLSSIVWEMQRRHSNALSIKIETRTTESKILQERALLLETLVESANDGIIITKADLENPGPEVIYVNEAFTRISGYSAKEIIGQSPRILQNEFTKRETLDEMKQTLSEGKPFKGELLNVHKNGNQYWLDISIVPVKNKDGAITHFAAIERDITQSKAKELKEKDVWVQLKRANMKAEAATRDLEESLARAEAANIAKGDFLANMSHELRTPMNGVLGMATLLADTKLDDEQREYVSTINSSGEGLLMLLNDILDFSKIEAGALELEHIAYNFVDTMQKTVNLLRPQAEKKNIELRMDCDAQIPNYMWGDSGRIRQIIMNLIGNAIKFTDHGHVRLKATLKDYDDKNHIHVSVEDTGIGIPAKKLGEIFEKFTQADASVTRKFGGTGLGLAITKQLVGLMGGEIGVDSAVGKGSTFWFSIPCKPAEATDEMATIEHLRTISHNDSPKMPVGEARALLVDDYHVNQVFAEKLLRKFGFQHIDTAVDGVEALLKCSETAYDVIFMDCQMPRMDGYITTQEIRALETCSMRHIPVVAMTANAMMGDREKCLNAGMDDYLSKPLRAEHLKKFIETWFTIDNSKASISATKTPSPETSITAETPVDMEQLRMFTDGDPDEEKALTELFLEQAQEMIDILTLSTGADKNEEWKSAAHRFKGSSGNLGAISLHQLCKRAENHFEGTQAEKVEILAAITAKTKQVEAFFAAKRT